MKVVIGFIAYEEVTAKYLPYFLPSLFAQSYPDFEVIAIDHSKEKNNENSRYIKTNYPELDYYFVNENQGFAKGFNRMIRRAIEKKADFFLAINPDMILNRDAVEKMVVVFRNNEKAGAVQPKILKWDYENNQKTDIIDSYGLYITEEHRFSDLRQGEVDDKVLQVPYEIFGFTGAAVMLKTKALRDAAYLEDEREEYFDELMFMYKEDCDLSYRLRLAGWQTYFQPLSVVYHHRTASPKGESNLKIAFNRRNKSKLLKQWSFLNHWILLLKIRKLNFSWWVKVKTIWYQLKSLVFVVLFEQFLLKEILNLKKLFPEIEKRRKQLKLNIKINEIEKFMIK